MQGFDIYFLGEMLPDADPQQTRREVARLFKISEDTVDRLFSGKAIRVKQNIDVEAAGRYRAAFRDAGALLQIVPNGSAPPSPKPEQTAPSLDTAQASPSSNDDTINLAEPGAIIDTTPAPPAADIDTGGLSAQPANTGSLEDCKVEKTPYAIPDISHLEIVDD